MEAANSRFVGFRQANRSWQWVPLSNTDWVPVITTVNSTTSDGSVVTESFTFDATYFDQMRVTMFTAGTVTGSVYGNLDVKGEWIFTRYGTTWTNIVATETDGDLGRLKMRIDHRLGVQGAQLLSDSARNSLQGDSTQSDGTLPENRINFNMDFLGTNDGDPTDPMLTDGNIFTGVVFRDHNGNNRNCAAKIEMR